MGLRNSRCLSIASRTAGFGKGGLDPSYTYAWSQRARVRYELGQYDAAINDAKTALEQDPKDFDAQYYLALSLEETGDIDGAIVSLSACLENAGTDAATNDGVRLKRVNLLLQAERATEAMKDLEVLIQLYPEDEQIYESRRQAFHLLGDTENAKRDALLVEQKHEAAQVAEILSLNERGMHQRALDVANQLLVRCPDSVQGLAGRAASKWYLMKYPEALEDYTAALSRTPNDADMLANRGKLYHDTGEYEKSIADFTKAIELKPLNSGLYHGRASAWRQLSPRKPTPMPPSHSVSRAPKNRLDRPASQNYAADLTCMPWAVRHRLPSSDAVGNLWRVM
jgi:tetratricopeptide (TPR) repeat protein